MQLGEMVYGVVYMSIRSLLNPELTASWELGLTKVAEGEITADEYMKKLDDFIRGRTDNVLRINNANQMVNYYNYVAQFLQEEQIMCGIVGYVGSKDCADVLIDSLSKLEYRGYDSAGIAVFEKVKYLYVRQKEN